ncbi:hypothetical protein N9J72_02360 [Candidatus Gracilibacteria bacterium]|nr:hypothetical protein [Candidatus Gracilibacteria bacterium]
MKFILVLFTLLLTLAWAYTSWYWYTCNIKGFCDITSFSFSSDSRVEDAKDILLPEREPVTQERISQQELIDENTEELSTDLPRVIVQNEEIQETEEKEDSSVQIIADEVTVVQVEETPVNTIGEDSICETPLVGPIEFGKNNDTGEVELLESFLISQGEDLEIDGRYSQDDFEAVKRFQLEYKAEILDPWGITEPTGFVFRTTVNKINEIACP